MVALIDYGSGNVRSVSKAVEFLGAPVTLTSSPGEIAAARAVVLPGVGHFGDCVENLRSRGLWEPIADWIGAGRPFLGICVGYQMLFEGSEEAPGAGGFGFFPGIVRRFQSGSLKVPQIGWNQLDLPDPAHWMWRGLARRPSYYFVHSYYPFLTTPECATAYSEYGVRFAASACRGNVAGVQFHPEKSQGNGVRLIRNFLLEAGVELPAQSP